MLSISKNNLKNSINKIKSLNNFLGIILDELQKNILREKIKGLKNNKYIFYYKAYNNKWYLYQYNYKYYIIKVSSLKKNSYMFFSITQEEITN